MKIFSRKCKIQMYKYYPHYFLCSNYTSARIDICVSHLVFQNISILKCVSNSPSSCLLLT